MKNLWGYRTPCAPPAVRGIKMPNTLVIDKEYAIHYVDQTNYKSIKVLKIYYIVKKGKE